MWWINTITVIRSIPIGVAAISSGNNMAIMMYFGALFINELLNSWNPYSGVALQVVKLMRLEHHKSNLKTTP